VIPRVVVVALFFATACAGLGTGDGLDPLPAAGLREGGTAEELRVDVGTGVALYEPLSEGAPVDVILGPQGGFHIWTSVRVQDPALEVARIDLSVRFADDGRAAGAPSSITASLAAVSGARERAGMTNFVMSPESVRGRRLILHADVFGQDGRRGFAERMVIPR
jgi:hypothetical protein